MFVIVMDRSVIICSIFLALVAASSCKSIGRNDENATASASITPVPIDSAEPTTEDLTPKSSLLTLPPSNDETKIGGLEDPDCSSRGDQKSERCKSLLRRDPRSQLASVMIPNSGVQPDPAEDRRSDIVRSLQEKLKTRDRNLGATLNRSPGRTRIIENDDYICYCREKNNPLSRKNGPPQPGLTRRKKPDRRPGNKKMLPGESRLQQNPLYLHQPYLSDGIHQYLPYLPPRRINPILRYPGGLPYVYQFNPSLWGPSQGKTPTTINVPIDPIAEHKHDSIVGQQTPGSYHNQQNVEQRCPPKHSADRQKVPAASSEGVKANGKPSGQTQTAEDANYNLQSVKHSTKKPENVSKDNNNLVGAAGPGNEHGTGSGTEDYSNVEEELHSTTEAYGGHLGDDEYGFYTTSGSVEGKTDSKGSLDGSTRNPSEDDLAGNKNIVPGNWNPSLQKEASIDDLNQNDSVNRDSAKVGQSNPLAQKKSSVEDLKKNPGQVYLSEDDSANDENTTLGQSNSLPQEESLIADLENGPGEMDPMNSANKENAKQGQNNPLSQEPATDTPNKNPTISDPDILNKSPRVTMASDKRNDDPESSSADPALMSDVGDINHGVTPGGLFTDYTEDPLNIDQDDPNSDKVGAKIEDAEDQEGPVNDSSMNADVTPSSRNNEDLENGRETVGAGNPAGIPEQALPFCDNSLLEKSIKTVINNFAAENDGDMDQAMLGSARDDLLTEIVDVPNLKGILSLPAVERTVLDKVKNRLATVTGLPRSKFDGEWPTSIIRNNLRHSLAAAPSTMTELPPNTIRERQFNDGKWVFSYVTIEPMVVNEDKDSGDDERMRASVKSLLRDPAVSLEAARLPVVQNIIVQSVQNTFQNTSSDLIQSVLDNELNLMELQNVETTTADENTGQTQAIDLKDIDINKFLEIAKNEAGVTESESTSTQDGLPAVGSVLSTREDAPTDVPGEVVDQERASLNQEARGMGENSKTPTGPSLSTNDAVPTIISSVTESPSNFVGATNNPRIAKYPGLPSTSSATQQLSPKTGSPVVEHSIAEGTPLNPENLGASRQESVIKNPCEVSPGGRVTDKSSGPEEDLKSVSPTTPFVLEQEVVGMRRSEETTPDYSYMGKITVTKNDNSDDIESLQNSELFYVGDGVRLPLEIRRLSDGSYALSISRKVCDHLLDKYCPCCVPLEGNVVRKVRREPRDEEEKSEERGMKRITKRESISPGLVDSDHQDSADDSFQISMPVETFARKYNLSLNLRKLQAPWNLAGKTDEPEKNGATNFENREPGGNANLRSLLAIHGARKSGKSEEMGVDDSYERSDDVNSRYRRQKHKKLDKDRYERNIDEKVNERVEIVTDVLYWLRDMILSAAA